MGRLIVALLAGLLCTGGCRARSEPARIARPSELSDSALAWPLPDRGKVEVRNAAGVNGLARVVARALRSQGFDVVTYGSHDAESDTTLVILRRGSADAAQRVRAALGQGLVRERRDSTRRVDVTVILGRDFRPAR